MKAFKNILFVSNGVRDETQVIQQAVQLAANCDAALTIAIICPVFDANLDEYQKSYEAFLLEKMSQTVATAKLALALADKELIIKMDIEWVSTPDIRIVQRVLRNAHDLVIKAAECEASNKGFKALDMALLRKCPCALYLYRPADDKKTAHIAVAVDPKEDETTGHELALRLLILADALATHFNARLSIISCWDFALERYMRTSVFLDVTQKEIDDISMNESRAHYAALRALVQQSEIKTEPAIIHLKGNPAELIPSAIEVEGIDMLVMGTVGRTGIAGFIIGNTAEDIVQEVNCSLWAIKPQGFVSPVKTD